MRLQPNAPALSFLVRHPPDAALLRVSDVQRAIRPHCETHRAITRIARVVVLDLARESVSEFLVGAAGLAVLHGLEHDLVSRRGLGRAVPAAMKRDECAVLVFRREALA